MELIGVAAHHGYVPDGVGGGFHQLCGLTQPQADQKLLGRTAHALFEELAEIAAVELAHVGQIFHRDFLVVIMLHEGDGLPDIKILRLASLALPQGRGGLDKPVQKQAQVANQVEGGCVGAAGHIEHSVLDGAALLRHGGGVNRLRDAQSGSGQVVRHPQAVECQPDVFPGVRLVGAVGVHLAGTDQKALVFPKPVFVGHIVLVVGVQPAPAGNYIMKQVVVAHEGTKGVQWCALLPAKLV